VRTDVHGAEGIVGVLLESVPGHVHPVRPDVWSGGAEESGSHEVMSLQDDVRTLAEAMPYKLLDKSSHCHFCRASMWNMEDEHYDGCPILALPRVLAVLEAAEQVVEMHHIDDPVGTHHVPTESPSWRALVKALRGEKVVPSNDHLTRTTS
jgi:hypothetical protein